MTNGNVRWYHYAIGGVIYFAVVFFLHSIIFPGRPSFFSLFGSGVGAVVVILLLFLGLFGGIAWTIGRSDKMWRFNVVRKRFGRLIYNELMMDLNKVLNKTQLFRKLWIRRRIPPDRLPDVLRENIVYLFSVSNYLKRLYIMYNKMGQVEKASEVAKQMWHHIGSHTDLRKLGDEIYICRSGGTIGEGGNIIEVGWFDSYKKIANHINDIIKFLKLYRYHAAIPDRTERIAQTDRDGPIAEDMLIKLNSLKEELDRRLTRYLEPREKAFGAHQPIKAWKYLVFDQCNPSGEYPHWYRFIEKGKPLLEPRAGIKPVVVPAESDLEVNLYGEVLIDKQKSKEYLEWIRPWGKVKLEAPKRVDNFDDVYEYYHKPGRSPMDVFRFVLEDWRGFIFDLRYGQFKPWSKSVSEYVNALTTERHDPNRLGRFEFYDEKNIPFHWGWKGAVNPAFDRRAKDDPGFMTYVGRVGFNNEIQNIVDQPQNPYPALSSRGMSLYIPALVKRDVDDIEEAEKAMMHFIKDMGATALAASEGWQVPGALGEREGGEQQRGG